MPPLTPPAGFYGATLSGADLPAAVPAPRAAGALATQAAESAQSLGAFGLAITRFVSAQQPIKDAELSVQSARLANQQTLAHKETARKVESMAADPTVAFTEVEGAINALGDTKPLWDALNPYLSAASQKARIQVEGAMKQYEDGVPVMRQELLLEARKVRTLAQAGRDASQLGEYIAQGGTLQGALGQVQASIAAIDAIGLDGPKRTEVVNKYGQDVGRVLTAALPAGTAVSFLQSDAADFIPGTVRAALLDTARNKAEQEALRAEARAHAAADRAEREQAKQQAIGLAEREASVSETPQERAAWAAKTYGAALSPSARIGLAKDIAAYKDAAAKVARAEEALGKIEDARAKYETAKRALDSGTSVEKALSQGLSVTPDIMPPGARVSPAAALKIAAEEMRTSGPRTSELVFQQKIARIADAPLTPEDMAELRDIYARGRAASSPELRATAAKAYEQMSSLVDNRALAALDLALAAMPGLQHPAEGMAIVAEAGGRTTDPQVQNRVLMAYNAHNVPIIEAIGAVEGGGLPTKENVDTYWQHVAAPAVRTGETTLENALHDMISKTGMMPSVMAKQLKKAIAEQDTSLIEQLATLPERDEKAAAVVNEALNEGERKAITTMQALLEHYPESPEIREQKFRQFMAPHDATKPGVGPNLVTVAQQTADRWYQETAGRSTVKRWGRREVDDLIKAGVARDVIVNEQARRGLWNTAYQKRMFEIGSGDEVAQLTAAKWATEFVDQRTGAEGRLHAPEVVYRIPGATPEETNEAYREQIARWHILAPENQAYMPLPLREAIEGAREKERFMGRTPAVERIAKDIRFVIVPSHAASPNPAYYVFWGHDAVMNKDGLPMVYVPNRELAAEDIGVQRRVAEGVSKRATGLRTQEAELRAFAARPSSNTTRALTEALTDRANRLGQEAAWWEQAPMSTGPIAIPPPEPLK